MAFSEAWQHLAGNRSIIRDGTVQEVLKRLRNRPGGPRNQAKDDEVLSPLADTTAVAISVGDIALAREAYRRTFPHIRKYEDDNGCEIHKGSAFFNVGVAHLTSFDLVAAMQFFEMAQEETRLTIGSEDYSVYEDDLFDRNFWEAVEQELELRPFKRYQDLWGDTLNKKQVLEDWRALSNDTKLGCILCWGEWIRIVRLEAITESSDTPSLGYARWGLVSDLSIMLETEIRHHSSIDDTLGKMLFQGFRAIRFGDLSHKVEAVHARHGVRNPAGFEATLPTLLTDIGTGGTAEDVLAAALYLLYICRNQVNHRIDFGMRYHADPQVSRDVIQIMFSLLSITRWAT